MLAQPYLPNPGHDLKLYNTGDEVFATVKRSPLHPGADVVEEQIPVTPELRELALAVGRAFGLDIYGIDVVETPDGYMVLDINDFPSFGKVPQAAERLARTVLRVTRRNAIAAAERTTTAATDAPRPRSWRPPHEDPPRSERPHPPSLSSRPRRVQSGVRPKASRGHEGWHTR